MSVTRTSVTLDDTGISDVINEGGRYDSARKKMFAPDFETQVQQMKAIGGQPDYALGSMHAVTRDGRFPHFCCLSDAGQLVDHPSRSRATRASDCSTVSDVVSPAIDSTRWPPARKTT
ncbi:MAG: hypothetical protein ACRDPO_04610 [Streptosporangiaceae bacterium]